jgi:outer membrane protein assembly factor BamB
MSSLPVVHLRVFPSNCSLSARFLVRVWLVSMVWTFGARGDWPQFLGPDRDAVSRTTNGIPAWPADGPKIRWKLAVGEGFAGPTVSGDAVLVFHRRDNEERLESLDAKTGRANWTNSAPTRYRDDFGFDEGPRAVPAIAAGNVFCLGAEGRLRCVELATGKTRWERALGTELKADKGFFGFSASPLVVGGLVFVTIGGDSGRGIVALDTGTGEQRWSATDHEAGYASPTLLTHGGQTLVLCFDRTGLVALEPKTGAVRFEEPWRSRSHASVNAANPVLFDDKVFITASYGTGAKLLRVAFGRPEEVWSNDTSLSSHYVTPVFFQGCLYGFHGRQETGGEFRCVQSATGKVLWTDSSVSMGQIVRQGDQLLVLTQDGELLLIHADPKRCDIRARAQILGSGVRAAPALDQGCLFARDPRQLVCVELESR